MAGNGGARGFQPPAPALPKAVLYQAELHSGCARYSGFGGADGNLLARSVTSFEAEIDQLVERLLLGRGAEAARARRASPA